MIRAAAAGLCAALLVPQAAGQNAAQTPSQQQLREIYKELVEINTTDSAGSCTQAAEAMAARLKAGGIPPQDVQVIVPPGGPNDDGGGGGVLIGYLRPGCCRTTT